MPQENTAPTLPTVQPEPQPQSTEFTPVVAMPKPKSFPWIPIFSVAIVVLIAVIVGMLVLTSGGRRLIGLQVGSTTSSITSSATTSSQGIDLSNDNADAAIQKLEDQINTNLEEVTPEVDLDTFDSQLEFGVN